MLVGLTAVGLAAIPNSSIESFFGRNPGELLWGPSLFRVLSLVHGLLLLAATRFVRRPLEPLHIFTAKDPVWALAGISIIAFALRLWKLDTSLWLDEILTMVDFVRPPLGHILTSFPNQNQHMLFSILGHASIRLFGESAWALRLPSVFFGVASIWALYLLARKLMGIRPAIIACALMALSYHHIWFSQNARGYMGVLFFTLLATWLWLSAIDSGRWSTWIAYGVVLFLGIWVHMTILFVIAAHGIIWLCDCLRQRAIDWKAPAAWLLCLSLTTQVTALALPEFFRSALHEVSVASEWTSPFWVVRESLRSLRVGFAGVTVLAGGLALVLAGWIDLLRRDLRSGVAMVLPALLGGTTMLILGHNLWPRFFFFSMGFAILIVVHGAMVLPRLLPLPERRRSLAGSLAAGVILAASALTIPRCYALPKQDFTGAREYVERYRTSGDEVVVVGLARHAYGRYYAPHWTVVDTPEELLKAQTRARRVLLVFTLPIELKAFHPDLWRVVEKEFEQVAVFPGTLGGGEIFLSRNHPRSSEADDAAVRQTESMRTVR
jgi:mannosyltransferase